MTLHTVVETPGYLSDARDEGMTEAEMKAAVDLIAANPTIGVLIKGAGGCRKVRIAGKGKGKSGGYRVVTYFFDETLPAYLFAVLAKGSRANFSEVERKALGEMAKYVAETARRVRSGNRE
ncbi:MAG: type II toxin-antitoxin system RelE/ParE family toxin [Pseudomonadota bacterium]